MPILIGLSTNLNDKLSNLKTAISLIQTFAKVTKKSQIYQTEAWGITEQPDYLNQIIEIETNYSAQKLLDKLQTIETQMGRTKTIKYGPRLIDLDILYYSDQIINTPTLQVPHPLNSERNFILIPLNEIYPNLIDPKLNQTIKTLLNQCQDQQKVKLLQS